MSQAEDLGDLVVPVEELCVDAEQFTTGYWAAWRVQHIQCLVYKLAQFTEALVHRPDIGRLLTGTLQWRT